MLCSAAEEWNSRKRRLRERGWTKREKKKKGAPARSRSLACSPRSPRSPWLQAWRNSPFRRRPSFACYRRCSHHTPLELSPHSCRELATWSEGTMRALEGAHLRSKSFQHHHHHHRTKGRGCRRAGGAAFPFFSLCLSLLFSLSLSLSLFFSFLDTAVHTRICHVILSHQLD